MRVVLSFPSVLISFLVLSLFGCSSNGPAPRVNATQATTISTDEHQPSAPLRAPWQLWGGEFNGDPKIAQGDQLADSGNFSEAISVYREGENSTEDAVREAAFIRRLGTTLKFGKSAEVLSEVSRFSAQQHKPIEELSPQISLIVAFAYEHRKDIDQTLAWLGVSYRASGGVGDVGSRARAEARRLVALIKPDAFEGYAARWSRDQFIGGVIAEERGLRRNGTPREERETPNWFSPETYGAVASAGVISTALPPPLPSSTKVIGVLLPLSGIYEKHGVEVKNGVEIASASDPNAQGVQFVFADTRGDPEEAVRAYEKLVNEDAAIAVLGPLLAGPAESVAVKSVQLRVPFITFTKRPGVTALSPVANRIGATASDQAVELAHYIREELGLERIAIVTSNRPSCQELSVASERELKKMGAKQVIVIGLDTLYNPAEISSFVSRLSSEHIQGVILTDLLDQVFGVIQSIKEQHPNNEIALLGGAAWSDPVVLRSYGERINGITFVTPFWGYSGRGEVVKFVDDYRARYGGEPKVVAAQVFDAARLLMRILSGGVDNSAKLAQSLRDNTFFDGVSGRCHLTGNGEIERRMSVVTINNGEAVEVYSAGIPTGAVLTGNSDGEKENNAERKDKD